MLSNIEAVNDLRSLARLKIRDYTTKTVRHKLVEEASNQGWSIEQKNERTVRLRKKKESHDYFIDRLWTLLYRMDFKYLNGDGPALLSDDSKTANEPPSIFAFDIVGVDDEVGIAIKCLTSEKQTVFEQIRQEIDNYLSARQNFTHAVNHQIPRPSDRQVKRLITQTIFTLNILISDEDKKYAKDRGVMIFDENDLSYYDELTGHLGSAAKYQFLADIFSGKNVPGLNIKVPAIRTRIGGYTCYTFPILPEYLLKIAYISHHSKGKNSDMGTYQRMLQKNRLKKIRRYIDQNGIFPTNIVINFEKKPTFHRGGQDAEQEGGTVGWLEVRSAYKSAWIIDGQHRLFAYSGHSQASKAYLSVLAFESLPASTQARLFIDINAEQKSVKQSLLQELYADLHKDATDPTKRVRAIVAQTIRWLDSDPASAFYERIQAAEIKKDDVRCISWNSIFRALDSDLFILTRKGEQIFGALWSEEGNDKTRERAVQVLREWFGTIRASVTDWWEIGAGDGGGIAMNDSIVASVNVLRSVFQHLLPLKGDLRLLSNQDLCNAIKPYAEAMGSYLNSFSMEERKAFRNLRGVQGQTTRMRRLQQGIQKIIATFNPLGLQEFIEEQQAQTNINAKILIDSIEKTLQRTVIDELKGEFGLSDEQWWFDGIPKQIRSKATQRYEEDDGQRGKKEYYFDLIDYRNIIQQHWNLFGDLLGYGKANLSKEKRTTWLNDINDVRKIVAHGSSGRSVTVEQLSQVEVYSQWFQDQVNKLNGDKDEDSDDE